MPRHEGVESAPGVVVHGEHRVFDGRLLKIDEAAVGLPGGSRATLESIRHPGAAAALPFVDDDTVLLVRQYRHAMGGYILEVPAGKIDDEEPPAVCARREVQEEVGHLPGRLEPLGAIFTTPGFTDEVIWLFEAHDLVDTGTAHEEDEVIEVQSWRFDQAIQAVEDGRIRDAKSVAAILHSALRRVREDG
ncbi:MAG TPA: NUDIX hydrolase [Candidatus Krumholzibacteria bacterium]|nr:NUDIX hydrolase [Candidatus Krumholzibacteria bacterium]